MGIQENMSSANRLMLYPGGINVFLPNAEHLYRARSAMGDNHGQKNADKFEKWTVEKWILSLPLRQ
jgi:hypothetical protein